AKSANSITTGNATSGRPAPRSMMRRRMIWYQRSGKSAPISRTPCGMNWYGYVEPDSTNDGMMKNTVMNTACAEVRANVETKTPTGNDGRTKGNVTRKSVNQLPSGQIPKTRPEPTSANNRTP